MNIEPQKVYADPDDMMPESEDKTMRTLANLVDRELVATIGWAKQVPGKSAFLNHSLAIDSFDLLVHCTGVVVES